MVVSVSKMKKPFLTKRSVPDNGFGKNVLRFFLERGLLMTVSSADHNLCQVDLLGGKSDEVNAELNDDGVFGKEAYSLPPTASPKSAQH